MSAPSYEQLAALVAAQERIIARLQARLGEQDARLAAQDARIVAQDARIAELERRLAPGPGVDKGRGICIRLGEDVLVGVAGAVGLVGLSDRDCGGVRCPSVTVQLISLPSLVSDRDAGPQERVHAPYMINIRSS